MIRSNIKLNSANTICELGSLIKIFYIPPHTKFVKTDLCETTLDLPDMLII